MKTTFHLDLDHSGVRLRRGSGKDQSILGEVALDDPHFETRLEDLRAEAQALSDGPLITDITIPQSEVLFTSIDLPEDAADDAARKAVIEAELEGLTPYALEDLVYDWKPKGKTEAAVAAVARETLDQAEDFAVSNGFNPQRFWAAPRKGLFADPPDFGQTTFAANGSELVMPAPSEPVTRIADLAFDEPEEASASQAAEAPPTPEAAEAPGISATEGAPGSDGAPRQGADVSEMAAPEADPATDQIKRPDADVTAEGSLDDARESAPRQLTAKAKGPATVSPTAPKAPEPEDKSRAPEPANADAGGPSPSFSTRRPAATSHAAGAASSLGTIASRIAMLPDGGAGPRPGAVATIAPPKAKPKPGAAAGPGPARKASPTPTIRKVAPPAKATGASLSPGDTGPVIHPSTPLSGIAARSEAEQMTVFGQRGDTVGGLSLVPLLVGVAVALALAVGIWAAFLLLSPSRGVSLQPARDTAALAPTDGPAEPDEIGAIDPTQVAPSEGTPDDQAALAPPLDLGGDAAILSPSDEDRLLVEDASPDLPAADRAPAPGDDVAALRMPEAEQAPGAPAEAPQPVAEAPVDDSIPAADDPLRRPADADEASRYAATGVNAVAPISPDAPTSGRVEDLYLSQTDATLRAQDRVAVLNLPLEATPAAPDALLPVPPPGERFELNADGRVVATEDGTLSPQGILVTAGAPPRVPPAAPDRPAESPAPPSEADLVIPVNEGTPTLRPRSRPDDAAPRDDAALQMAEDPPTAAAASLVTRIAGLSPLPRPATPGSATSETQSSEPDTAEAPTPAVLVNTDPTITPLARPASLVVPTPSDGTSDAATTASLAATPAVLVNTDPETSPQARPASLTARLNEADTDAATATGSAAASATAAALASLVPELQAAVSPFAVSRSLRPETRPRGLAARAAEASAKREPVRVAQASAVVRPSGQTRGSVASRATIANAINLRRVNLVGVYGTQSNRRALVRLPSGRFVKVKVGDRVDGGRVRAIGDGQLSYVKGGRSIVLQMPRG